MTLVFVLCEILTFCMAFILFLVPPVCRTEQHIVSLLSPLHPLFKTFSSPPTTVGEAEMKCAMEKQTKFVAVPKRRRGV